MRTSNQLDNVASVKRWDTTRWKELTLSEDCLEEKAPHTETTAGVYTGKCRRVTASQRLVTHPTNFC